MRSKVKGFTLVELIVVIALMGIIMAGVFSIIQPTARMTSRINSTKNEETAAFQVTRSLNSILSYATKVTIYGVNEGDTVPKPSNPTDYNYVYIIDNVNARSLSKKGAKGIIYRANFNGSTGIIGSKEVVGQEPLLGEDNFKITIDEYGAGVDNNYIMLNFECSPMIPDETGDAYEPDSSQKYYYRNSIEFININQKNTLNNGAKFMLTVDSSVEEKSDYYYIYFMPATKTLITDASSSESSEESSEEESSEEESSEVETKTVTFEGLGTRTLKSNGLNWPNIDDPAKTDITKDKYASYWVDASGRRADEMTFDDISDTTTFYLGYETKATVQFYDFKNLPYGAAQYVAAGYKPVAPTTTPDPPNGDTEIFDEWVQAVTYDSLDKVIIENGETYKFIPTLKTKPTNEEEAKQVTIKYHYLTTFYGNIRYSNTISINGQLNSGYQNNNVYKNIGEVDTLVYKDQSSIDCYVATYDKYYAQPVQPNKNSIKDGDTVDLYVYYDDNGAMHVDTSIPSYLKKTSVKIHIVDDMGTNVFTIGSKVSKVRADFDINGKNGVVIIPTKPEETEQFYTIGASKGDTITMTIRSPINVSIGTASIAIDNDGLDKEYWYTGVPFKGKSFSKSEVGEYSVVTINFIDACPNANGINIWDGSTDANPRIWIKDSGSATAIDKTDQLFSFGGAVGTAGSTVKFAIFQQTGIGNGLMNKEGYKLIFCSTTTTYNYTNAGGFVPVSGDEPDETDLCDASIEMQGNWGVRVILKNNTGNNLTGAHKIVLTTESTVTNSGASGDKWGSLTYDNASVGTITSDGNEITIEFNLSGFANGAEKDFYFKPSMSGTYNVTGVKVI
ncbi:MAG: prepilin-type N-terminal cleavage/methylation domain-containing protein [Ruminococcus sp.]|nr:prepilin-type N-terminal cleavage/methylation domain-containing protein [Ruminococcus sp.]